MLHEKVEELDAILIEQATRVLRREEAPTGYRVWEGLEKDERDRLKTRARVEAEARELDQRRSLKLSGRKRWKRLIKAEEREAKEGEGGGGGGGVCGERLPLLGSELRAVLSWWRSMGACVRRYLTLYRVSGTVKTILGCRSRFRVFF